MKREIVEASQGIAERAAYAAGIVDGIMWLLLHGPLQADHLKRHMVDRDGDPIMDVAVRAMEAVYESHSDIFDYMADSRDTTGKILDIWPECGPRRPAAPPTLDGQWRRTKDPTLN